MFDLSNAEKIAEKGRSCLSRDEILDVATGRATGDRLAGIDAHVGRCESCQLLVVDAKASGSGAHELNWGVTFREGDVVAGRYRIHRFIARGGMGEVYDAFDRELQERVALKTVLSTSSDSVRAVRRLRIEVQLAHRVSHPNVCRIYDLGTHVLASTGGTLNFLTMEFVDGESLRARIERGKLSVGDSVAVARQLLLGLTAAHAAGILHRDFKSENVMLRTSKDGPPGAVIMDFGLASPLDPSLARLTSGANALVGTPCYMSPEQLEGAQLSAASDLYSFGIVWFEMLTGQLPFSLRTPFDRLRRDAPRPSRFSADVPAALDAIVTRCLARRRETRFTTAEEVLAALDAVEARPLVARAPQRRRALGIVVACVCSASLLGWAALEPHRHAVAGVTPGEAKTPTPHPDAVSAGDTAGATRASTPPPLAVAPPTPRDTSSGARASGIAIAPHPRRLAFAAPRAGLGVPPVGAAPSPPEEVTSKLAGTEPALAAPAVPEPEPESEVRARAPAALSADGNPGPSGADAVRTKPVPPRAATPAHRQQYGFLDPFHGAAGK